MNKVLIILVFVLFPIFGYAQTEMVTDNLRLVSLGKINDVRQKIPELVAQYPNDPGVKLLLAVVLEDAYRAIDIYKEIIRDYPQSQWADDAYWRIIQFYAVMGDTTRATNELDNFRVRYPASPYIGPASDVVRSALTLTRSNQKRTTDVVDNKKVQENSLTESDRDRIVRGIPPIKSENELQQHEIVTFDETTHAKKELDIIALEEINSDSINAEINLEEAFYGLQVGIYQNKEAAENEKTRFLNRRLRTEVVEKMVNNKKMFAVVIGHYTSVESAEMAKIIVQQQCNCEPIIYQK